MRTADFQISVVQFDYGIFVSPGSGTLPQTGSISTVVAAVLPYGDSSSTTLVSLSASFPPSLTGVTATFSPGSCNPNCSSTLTFTASSTATTGTYSIPITSTEGALTKTITFTLTVAPFNFNLSVSPNSATIVPTASVSTLVTATLVSGTSASVSFGISTPLPTGITATFTPPNCNLTCSSTLTFSATSSAANGNYPLTITSTSIGLTQTAGFTLTVGPFDFSVSVSPSSATVVQTASVSAAVSVTLLFSDTSSTTAVSFGIGGGGLPAGITATFSPASCNPNCSSTVTLSATSAAATGTFSFGIVADNGAGARRSAPFALTVAPFDFSISVSPSGATVVQTASISALVSVTLPFSDTSSTTTVSFGIGGGGPPLGITATFSPAGCNPNCSSTVTFSASPTAATGTFTVTIIGTGGGIGMRTTSFTLTVNPFDYSLTPSPSSGTLAQSGSISTVVSVVLPFSDTSSTTLVSLSASFPPSLTGVTATFSPGSCNPNCSSTLTFTASSTATTGTFTVTIIGTGGGIGMRTTSFTLTVIAFDFSISASPSSVSVVQFTNVSATVLATLVSAPGTGAPVSFTASPSLPSGIILTIAPTSCNPNCSSIVTFSVDSSVTPGPYSTVITGAGEGLKRTVGISLTVVAFQYSVSLSPNTATIAQTGSISGAAFGFAFLNTNYCNCLFFGNIDPTSVPSGVTATPSLNGASVTFSVSSTQNTGSFTITIIGHAINYYPFCGQPSCQTYGPEITTASSFTLTVVPSFDYFVSVSPNSGLLVQAASISVTVTASIISGSTSGPVSFTTTNPPPSVTIAANDCTPNCSTALTFTAYSTTPTGTFTVTIIGNDFGIMRMTSFTLTIGPGPSVGGEVVPVDRLGLLAPYLALSSIIILSTLAMIYQLFRRRRIEGQSTSR
ncbi:MAG TPA: hypothetical protein VEL71_05655 [Candidatus Dormibacteraeota bacterium]|nr:hypothetical protein [Candidatus Dormibacteraeota bacterium]